MPRVTEQDGGVDGSRPEWFAAFLADRGTRKPSAHTLKAYCHDFDAIATLIAGGEDLPGMALADITIDIHHLSRYTRTASPRGEQISEHLLGKQLPPVRH